MARIIIFVAAFVAVVYGELKTEEPNPIIQRTNLADCPNDYCQGKGDGKYPLPDTLKTDDVEKMMNGTDSDEYLYDYFLHCSNGMAYCKPCAYSEDSLYYVACGDDNGRCETRQAVMDNNACDTSAVVLTALNDLDCSDIDKDAAGRMCAEYGPDFCGNRQLSNENGRYLGCWKGAYVHCNKCPPNLVFYELYNYKFEKDDNGHCGYRGSKPTESP